MFFGDAIDRFLLIVLAANKLQCTSWQVMLYHCAAVRSRKYYHGCASLTTHCSVCFWKYRVWCRVSDSDSSINEQVKQFKVSYLFLSRTHVYMLIACCCALVPAPIQHLFFQTWEIIRMMIVRYKIIFLFLATYVSKTFSFYDLYSCTFYAFGIDAAS